MRGIPRLLKKHHFLIPIDFLFGAYLFLLSLLIFIFQKNLPNWYLIISLHLILLTTLYFYIKKAKLKFFRYLYPLFLLAFFYYELTYLSTIFWPDWLDVHILDLELKIYGQHPNVILERLLNKPLTEILSFSYLSSYLIILIPPFYFYAAKRMKIFSEFMESISITFFLCSLFFLLMPTQGPMHELANYYSINPTGYIFTSLQNWIMQKSTIYGGLFSTAHIAIICTSWIVLTKHFKKLPWFLLPIIILSCFGAVYLRYNYFSDIIAGLLISWLALYLRDLYNEYLNKRRNF